MIRNSWYVAGFSHEFKRGDVQGQTIAGRPIVLWRTSEGAVTALDARCAHKRFPLWEGRLLEDGSLECAYHGFAYDADGRCVAIPALHDRSDKIPKTARQHKYPLVEQDGLVWLWTGEPEASQRAKPPPTPELGSADWEVIPTAPMHVAASAHLLIENLFDLTHFYPLHADNIGTLEDARVPVEIERETKDGLPVVRTIRRRRNFRFAPMTVDRFGVEVGDQIQIHEMVGPGLFHVIVKVAPPGKLDSDEAGEMVLYQTITPATARSHVWRRAICCRTSARWARDPSARSLAEAIAEGAPRVVEQDWWAIEQQQKMMDYPDDGYKEVHIKTDGAVIMARRILDELLAEELKSEDQSRTAHGRNTISERARTTADIEELEA